MNQIIHLTNNLQIELNKIGSNVILHTHNNSIVKMNCKDYAWAIVDTRSIEASNFVELNEKYLQLEESGIIACIYPIMDILEMAIIIDKWLGKQLDMFQIAEQHKNIKINKTYQNLKTLSIDEILEHRWTYFNEKIAKGKISFRLDVFEEFRKHFSFLYPIFSHDNLSFSNVIEVINDDFKTPMVFCEKNLIWVGFFKNNSDEEGKHIFQTKSIHEAIEITNKLLPSGKKKTINPLIS